LSEFEKLRVVIGYEFLKHVRRKRLYGVLALTILPELAVLTGLPALLDGYPDNIMEMAAMLSIGPSLATIGAIFLAGDAIAGEFESKTGLMLFPNPVRRITLVTGKYLACYVAVALVIAFGHLILSSSLVAIYGHVPVETVKSFGLCLLFAGSVLSVTFFFSSVSKGAMGAIVRTLFFIILISGAADSAFMLAGKPRWFLLSTNGESIITAYGGYELLLGGTLPPGMSIRPEVLLRAPDINLMIVSMVIYLVVGLGLSILISRRRQLA